MQAAVATLTPPSTRRAFPVLRNGRIEWRCPTTGQPVDLRPADAPKRRNLWSALSVAVTAEDPAPPAAEPLAPSASTVPEGPAAEVIDLVDDEAHLAYLARVAFRSAGESIKAVTPETRVAHGSRVVSLDAFRARRAS